MTKVVSVDDPVQSAAQPVRLTHPCHLQWVLIAAGFVNRRHVTGVGHQLHPLRHLHRPLSEAIYYTVQSNNYEG
jgi:hypothetical protein